MARMCASGAAIVRHVDLRAEGRSRRWIEGAVAAHRLSRVRRGIYSTPEACDAVVRAAAHGGVPGCITAARHLGLWVLTSDERIHVTLGPGGHAYPHPSATDECGCVEHWDDADGQTVPQVLRQILTCFGAEEFFVALESALHKRIIDDDGLAWLRRRSRGRGREALDLARRDAESGLESLLRWRLRRYGLPVRTQVHIPSTGRVDLLVGDSLIVEADGEGNHAGAGNRHRDLVRDAHSAMWGYSTLRFDYAMIVHDWDLVERAILGRVGRLA